MKQMALIAAVWAVPLSAVAADRVNVMPDRQARPGATVLVFGNAGSGGGIADGTANGEQYTWSFAANPDVQINHDGNLSGVVGDDRYIVEPVSFTLLNGSTRTLVEATLTVDDGAGNIDSDTVTIDVVDPADAISDTPLEHLAIDVNIAIEESKRFIYLRQRSDGSWANGNATGKPHLCAATAFNIWALANSGHLPDNDFDEDIYAETTYRGAWYIRTLAFGRGAVNQAHVTAEELDINGNGRHISLCGSHMGSRIGYANAIAAAGLIAAWGHAPQTELNPGGRTWGFLIEEGVEYLGFGQSEWSGWNRGGWRYQLNTGADTSADSWNYLAMEGYEAVLGGTISPAVKREVEHRLSSSQFDGPNAPQHGQFNYQGSNAAKFFFANHGQATTAGGLSGLLLVSTGGYTPTLLNGALAGNFGDVATRKQAAIDWLGTAFHRDRGIHDTWAGNRNNLYAMWTTARALRLAGQPTLENGGVTFDWETGEEGGSGNVPGAGDPREGYFHWLVRTQDPDGSWAPEPGESLSGAWPVNLRTAWGLLILQPTVFGPPVSNEPPTAICQSPVVSAGPACQGCGSVDGGSFDPDGDPITIEASPVCPYPLGDTEVTLTVTDDEGLSDQCVGTVTVLDETPPSASCNAPETITPPDAPICFTATADDNCGAEVAVTGYDCWMFNGAGKRVDKTESCVVQVEGDTICILDSGGVGDNIGWTVLASDDAGNLTQIECGLTVENPGGGGGNGGNDDQAGCNQGVGNGPEGCDPGNSNQGNPANTNDEAGGTPGNPGKRGGR